MHHVTDTDRLNTVWIWDEELFSIYNMSYAIVQATWNDSVRISYLMQPVVLNILHIPYEFDRRYTTHNQSVNLEGEY